MLAKKYVGGFCGNIHIVFEEDIMKEATWILFSNMQDGVITDDKEKFGEWWNYEGARSPAKGSQGGLQRLKSKHQSQLEYLASKLVRVS